MDDGCGELAQLGNYSR